MGIYHKTCLAKTGAWAAATVTSLRPHHVRRHGEAPSHKEAAAIYLKDPVDLSAHAPSAGQFRKVLDKIQRDVVGALPV